MADQASLTDPTSAALAIIRNSQKRSRSRYSHIRRVKLYGILFRSRWEARYAAYLEFQRKQGFIKSWSYEPRTFWFKPIIRGTMFYTPDFLIRYHDSTQEYHEVKGYMDAKSKTKLKRMKKYYPDEIVRIIDEKWFKKMERSGLPGAIHDWV